MEALRTRRLGPGDRAWARRLFTMMGEVFGEEHEPLSDGYVDRLLNRSDFWAMAAVRGDEVVGGITAHTLPMTRNESSEIFIYDVAVREDYQRRGVGRRLIEALREAARTAGIGELMVPADNDDVHARDFYRAVGGIPSPVTLFTLPGAGRHA